MEEIDFSAGDLGTGVGRSLAGAELAREVVRQELAGFRAERASSRLADAVRLGDAVHLPVAEMERMAGVSRQTIYNAKAAAVEARFMPVDGSLLQREVLTTLVAAGGAVPIAEIAARLQRDPLHIQAAVRGLADAGLCRPLSAGYEDPASWDLVAVAAEPAAEQQLRARFDELYVGRVASFAVYLAVSATEVSGIEAAARSVLSGLEHTLIAPNVAPSQMSGHELAIAVYSATSRLALHVAYDLWDEIRNRAGLQPQAARVVAVIPPTPAPQAPSDILDAFAEAIIEKISPAAVASVLRHRAAYAGGVTEKELAIRCLTAAATAMRRAVGQDRDPRPISDGEAAFGELMSVSPLHVDRARDGIQKPLVQALKLATDRLGPFPGGRLGSFKHPDEVAVTVEDVSPTPEELLQMALFAGAAVAAADGAVNEYDAAEAMALVARG